jgi:hypothetical protein
MTELTGFWENALGWAWLVIVFVLFVIVAVMAESKE